MTHPPFKTDFADHKDQAPGRTVKRITRLLAELGFDNMVSGRLHSSAAGTFSMILTDARYPVLTTNGKGTTEEMASAGAFGEFMERLQCMNDSYFGQLGDIVPRQSIFHDSILIPEGQLRNEYPEIMDDLLEPNTGPDKETVDALECLPFHDVFRNREIPLPNRLLLPAKGSTGMCAGNTPEEALVQGICEVMERYAIRLVAQDEISALPTIRLDIMKIHTPGLRRILRDIEKAGLKLMVKDCSLNGRIPVLAAALIDDKKGKFGLSFGSDPVFDQALQRCITELYQGRDELSEDLHHWSTTDMQPDDYFNNVHAALGFLLKVPPNMRDTSAPPHENAFTRPGLTNADYLGYVLKQIGDMGFSVYVRDFSFLGFPSFYVYIPGMSVPRRLSRADHRFHLRDSDELFRNLCRITELSPNQLRRTAELIESRLFIRDIYSAGLTVQLSWTLMKAPVVMWMEPIILIVFIFLEVGDHSNAARALRLPRSTTINAPCPDLSALLLDWSTAMLEGCTGREALARLLPVHGNGPYKEQLHRLPAGEYASLYLQDAPGAPGRKFSGLPIPGCTDLHACSGCACGSTCHVKRFLLLRGRMRRMYQPVDQKKIGITLADALKRATG